MDYYNAISTPIHVRPNDLDSLGHVNNAIVLEYFELGRWDWMAYHQLRQCDRILPVVAKIEVNYRREIRPDALTLITTIEPCDLSCSYQVHFSQTLYQVQDGAEKVVAEGKVKVAFLHAEDRKLCSLQAFLDDHAPQTVEEIEHAIA